MNNEKNNKNKSKTVISIESIISSIFNATLQLDSFRTKAQRINHECSSLHATSSFVLVAGKQYATSKIATNFQNNYQRFMTKTFRHNFTYC